ncbi:hypothetical protein [Sinorhizobium psoraleae]|uniref:Transmembrane protein n=1 Tax=Sinorhizobium psoraleae TaxID=520838 RepID=A0ABT4KLV8_9HYPH|nr:hypothetical protein [Sinorhizobium psoraleae]MCZ4092944.1 hypothetical protein [Sinorhizobium psoraleae]
MKIALPAICLGVLLAACASTAPPSIGYSRNLEPIPGSITYGGQPRTKLTEAPVGSIVPHRFRDKFGRQVSETYVIEPDRSLQLISRRIDYDLPSDR